MNKDAYTNEQKKRSHHIDLFLQNYKEFDIPTHIIRKINKLHPDTKRYDFMRTEQVEIGIMVRLVDLDLQKIYMPGIIVSIKDTSSRKKGILTLFNPKLEIYWSVNPDKYYIFKIHTKNDKLASELKEIYKNSKT